MRLKLLAVGVLLMGVVPLFAPLRLLAHHGGASLYDMSKEMTVDATVTEYQWTNPHVEIGMDAKDGKGRVKHWIIELNSPPVLANRGWNRKSLTPGDVIKITFNPSSRGGNVGRFIKLVKADGKEMLRGWAEGKEFENAKSIVSITGMVVGHIAFGNGRIYLRLFGG